MNREKRVRLSEKVIKIEETLRRIVNPRGGGTVRSCEWRGALEDGK